jgi:antitoxin YefM
MFNMSTHSLRELRTNLGSIVRKVAYTGEETIITDSGTEIAVIISMADYERLHEHADVADALRLRQLRQSGFSTMSMTEMLDALGDVSAEPNAS